MPAFVLSCLAYLGVAVPSSTLGLLWPSIRHSFGVPVSALGALLVVSVIASAGSSAATGRILSRYATGPVVAAGTALIGLALAEETLAPSLWAFAGGVAVFGLGFGALDSALNAYAAARFGAREITWMHASYGLGATIGPVLVTALLASGFGWRDAYGILAAAQAAMVIVLIVSRRAWPALPRAAAGPSPSDTPEAGRAPRSAVLGGLVFTAVETGLETGAGIWGYIFLTSGRGLSAEAAGLAVSAYWATMFAGRLVLGPLAGRLGANRVLAGAVVGVVAGAALMASPGPAGLAVAGLAVFGLAAAPVFPLFILTTSSRIGAADATTAVSLQVAASAVGSALLPGALGLAIGAFGARSLAPLLVVLGLAMGVVYALLPRALVPQ